ncbi:MAG: TetR/AcrR family transcriptional regulator [Alphaproteobacteria bacterium]|nr:TetR/AcrR family transcriptional regulator [Alphaproteobacteria bacterium]
MTKNETLPRVARKRERTRGELVAAAERLVAVRGLDALSIDEITEEADVAKGTFYTHFTDKDDLAAAIGNQIRIELEERITATNEGIADTAVRMANGLSLMLAFAIAQPVRARALLRLIPGGVDPETPINAGIRGDIAMGMKSKRFAVASVNAAVVAMIGIAMSTALHLTDTTRRVAEPYAFAAEALATALLALGMKQADAVRIANAAVNNRRKDIGQ